MLCLTLLLACLPVSAFAESADTSLFLTAGEVQKEFVPAGIACTSSDPSIAWVDEAGTLNALKSGSATITVPSEEGQTEYTVTVSDYSDGSEIVGNLKILARYNDSMQFYDGHVYLLLPLIRTASRSPFPICTRDMRFPTFTMMISERISLTARTTQEAIPTNISPLTIR